MLAIVSPVAYGVVVALAVLIGAGLCVGARRRPGAWTVTAARAVGVVLAGDAVSFTISQGIQGQWSASTSLPLALCNMAVLVAVAACWWQVPLLVELTWFWGLAGTIQAVITPDLAVAYPHLVFFQYLVGHLGIVLAALYLVVGMGLAPRRGAVRRVFGITVAYTAFVGAVDAVTGANYMFLRQPPANWTLLRLLGPWPWYILSAAGVAIILLVALDAPFWAARRRHGTPRGQQAPPRRSVPRAGRRPQPAG